MPHDRSALLDDLLERTSRTFAVGIRRLPGTLRSEITVAYLLLRVSDYFEDNRVMSEEAKIRALGAWAEAVRGAEDFDLTRHVGEARDAQTPDTHAALAAREIADALSGLDEPARSILRRHVADSTLGMARWVRRGPDFATVADLDDYMFEVAGRVGLLLTELFAAHSHSIATREEELSRRGVEFGLALQTVNVIRGLNEDPDRGWIFVPRELLPPGRSPSTLWDDRAPDVHQLRAEVLAALVDKAERHLEEGLAYTLAIPRRMLGVRVFCLLPLFFAARTLALSRENPLVFSEEVKLTRSEVRSIVRRTQVGALSDAWCRRTFRTLLGSPHPDTLRP